MENGNDRGERLMEIESDYAVCEDCGLSMGDAASCTCNAINIDGQVFIRNSKYFDVNQDCHDCGIENKPGNYHHYGCDIERCPKCKGQLLSCDCENKREVFQYGN